MAFAGRRKFLGDYLAVGLGLSLQSLRPLVFIPIITNYMGIEAYGVWAQVVVTAMFLSPILTLMFMSALTRYLAGSHTDHDISRTYLFSVLVVAGMSALILLLTALGPGAVSRLVFGDVALTPYVGPCVAFACCSALLSMLATYFCTVGRQVTYALFRSAEILGQCALVFLLGPRVGISLCIYALSGWMFLVALVVLAVIVARHGIARPSVSGFPGMWRFAFWMLLAQLLFFAAGSAGRYVIVAMMGLESVAVYMVALQVAHIIGMVAAPNQLVLLPPMSAYWNSGQPERARPLIRLAFLVQAVMGLSAVAMMQQLAQPLISTMTRRGFLPAPALVFCLSGGVFLYGWFQLSEMAFRMTHRFAALQVIIAAGSLVNIALALLLIPRLGLLGAGLAYLGSMTVLAVSAYVIAFRALGAGADLAVTIKAGILAVLIYLALAPLNQLPLSNVARLALGVFVSGVTFVAGTLLLRIYRLADLRSISTLLRSPRQESPPQFQAEALAADVLSDRSVEGG